MSFGFSCCIEIVALLGYFGVGSIAFAVFLVNLLCASLCKVLVGRRVLFLL